MANLANWAGELPFDFFANCAGNRPSRIPKEFFKTIAQNVSFKKDTECSQIEILFDLKNKMCTHGHKLTHF